MSIERLVFDNKFLGRSYDPNTDSWVFSDGTGRITNMDREAALQGRDKIPLIDVWHFLDNHQIV